jgi:tetratricopeptide (TPR) repeat protein
MNRKQRRAEQKLGAGAAPRAPAGVAALFAAATAHHGAGRVAEAERLYRQVLAADPRHADSLHLLGVIAALAERYDAAIDMIGKAIAINPKVAAYHANLGGALTRLARLDEAVACYRRAIDLMPGFADAHSNLGVALRELGRPDEAIASYRRAIALRPGYPDAHCNLAVMLAEAGQLDEAIACCRRAIELRPDYPEAHSNLGNALIEKGRLNEAAACCRRAIALRPGYPEAHNNLGNALQQLGRLDEAVACYRAATDLRPGYLEAHTNLGKALQQQGRVDEAIACYRRALDLKPGYPDAHNNLGSALQEQGEMDAAIACYRRAIDLRPAFPRAHVNLALALLATGDLAAGWVEYEWRAKTPELARDRRNFRQPQWRGEAAAGRTLLIHAEQGFGDTLQFCRYAAMALARGLRVFLWVQEPLVRLLRGLPGVDLVAGRGEALPDFDLHCPMLSLPLAFATTLASIPATTPYLHADPAQVAAWRTRLAAMPNQTCRIGLAWAGSSIMVSDRRRSLPPERLAPLFDVPGAQFFNLQKDGPAAPAHFPLTDVMAEMADFADTAALIATLDLVISVDTAVAHLAAALGKPVWLLDRFAPDWRWLLGRRDSPWYPTLRLYRQPRPGDWDSVIADIVRDLRARDAPG